MINFITATELYAIVKEELKSYFASGVVTDVMFPKWTEMIMARFKKSSLPIKTAFIPIKNYVSELPDDFNSVKEIWACGLLYSDKLLNPSSHYYQMDCRITEINDPCNECFDACDNDLPNKDERYRVTHKVTGVTHYDYYVSHLLRPGTRSAVDSCHGSCPNLMVDCVDTFDIQGCNIATSFREGSLHLLYYSNNFDEDGELLIPDDIFIKDYIIKFLKFKVFESLLDAVSDETFNQIQFKLLRAENASNIAREIAYTERKKLDKYQVQAMITERKNRFNNYRRSIR